ncbi:MAG: hypothetical protein HRT35_29820, partial [Algicola sp.]|nr:hypothetical protein [Algicola sp.]
LIFLPILPLALVGIFLYGLGLLPLAPLVSMLCAWRGRSRIVAHSADSTHQGKDFFAKGIGMAMGVLLLLDLPMAATYVGVKWVASDVKQTQSRGLWLLRNVADRQLLLRLCYDRSSRTAGLLGFFALYLGDNMPFMQQNRQIFYQVTGDQYSEHSLPFIDSQWPKFGQFDGDQGGTQVGGKVKDLELISSRIDGSVSPDDGVAYIEWVLEFENNATRAHETRLNIVLPPNAVVSRATLWVNGEEREAAFAGRGQVREAYNKVVRTLRDPLLVTTAGPDRILAQAFPVGGNGGKIKFRIGITAPLALDASQNASLVLPAITERNFVIGDDVEHALWIESSQSFSVNLENMTSQKVNPTLFRINGKVSDKALINPRPVLIITLNNSLAKRVIQDTEDRHIVQTVQNIQPQPVDALMIVVDGSAKLGAHIDALISALASIPPNAMVGLIISADFDASEGQSINIAPWTETQKDKFKSTLSRFDFIGGEDNAPALASAMTQLESYNAAQLLWIHAPLPVLFEDSQSHLNQVSERLTKLPHLSIYNVMPGPNKLLNDNPKWAQNAQKLPLTADVQTNITEYLHALFSTESRLVFHREAVETSIEAAIDSSQVDWKQTDSKHVLRLWAKGRIDALTAQGKIKEAIDIAARYQLVTNVSGAVVLESKKQYDDADLTPVDSDTVPTIPEPHQWILALIMVAFILWFLRQNKAALTRPA